MTREEAIDRLKEARAGHKEFLSVETLNMAIKALEQEPKTGHWIKTPNGFKCSKCLIVHSHTSIFCPSCGAKMVEPQESEGVNG